MTEAIQQEDRKQHWEDKKLVDQTAEKTQFYEETYINHPLFPGRKLVSVPMPPGFSWEKREANIRQYWKDEALYEKTAKNTVQQEYY